MDAKEKIEVLFRLLDWGEANNYTLGADIATAIMKIVEDEKDTNEIIPGTWK